MRFHATLTHTPTAEFTPVRDLMALWLPTAEVLDDADLIPPTE